MADKITLVRGMKDIHPEEMGRWLKLEATARQVFARYGYFEFRSPILEKLDLFVRGVGETTDIVEKEMYAFKDTGDEMVALRPEGTASVVRAFIESGGSIKHPEWNVFYIGPMFRRERPQKGRYRQFHQIGIESFGSPSAGVDAEQIKILWVLVNELGIKGPRFGVNSLGCNVCRPVYRKKLIGFFEPHREALCENCKRRFAVNPLRILDCKEESCKAISKNAPLMMDNLCGECSEHFDTLKRSLNHLGLHEDEQYYINPHIVRGLDYYDRTAFELLADDERLGSQNAIAGGGRYDNLVETLGGQKTPAVGWALGSERMISLIDADDKKSGVTVYVAAFKEAYDRAIEICEKLRERNINTTMSYDEKSLKTQMKRANRLGARFVAILGMDELENGKITLKNLETSEQILYNVEEIFDILQKSASS